MQGAPKWFYYVLAAAATVVAMSIATWAWNGTRNHWEWHDGAVFNPRTGVRCWPNPGRDTLFTVGCRNWLNGGYSTDNPFAPKGP